MARTIGLLPGKDRRYIYFLGKRVSSTLIRCVTKRRGGFVEFAADKMQFVEQLRIKIKGIVTPSD
jgi:hypothetical protein